jgi:alanine racemase
MSQDLRAAKSQTYFMKLKLRELAEAIDAQIIGSQHSEEYTISIPLTDSRSLTDATQTVFFALRTAAGDGHNYLNQLYDKGVRVFVVDKPAPCLENTDAILLKVDNTGAALAASGAYVRNKFTGTVIAITGSTGKTLLKEAINRSLKDKFNIIRSPRSWNSQIGVPLSLWQLDNENNLAIIEAGISTSGEMQRLESEIKPTIGIFTSITDEHERGFQSIEEKCREKAQLFANCQHILYPANNTLIVSTIEQLYHDRNLHAINGNNADFCKAVAEILGVEANIEEQSEDISTRIDITDTPDSITLAYDHFTCDLQGIATALDVVRRRTKKQREFIAIIGDMQCSCSNEAHDYAALEKTLLTYGVTGIICAGETISKYVRTFTGRFTRREYFDKPADVARHFTEADFFGSTIYISGNNKSEFAEILSWLSRNRHITRLEVNLDSLAHNYRHYRSLLPSTTGLIGMIKASGYGCGDLEVARTLQSQGADMVAVAVVDEGVTLRKGGVTMPILVLDPLCENMRAIFANNLEATIIAPDEEIIKRMEYCADLEDVDTFKVHLKLDTGMHRVGLTEGELEEFIGIMKRHPRMQVASIFSHLATADCLDKDAYTEMQLSNFERMSSYIIANTPYPIKRHILNTAGITRYGKTHVYDMARLGIGLYGISPLDAEDAKALKPVARLVTRIIATRKCDATQTVGYSCNGKLNRESIIATLPVGYADGIDRRLGNRNAYFLVNGTKCPTIGNICMDLCMIDITDCKDIGDGTVEIFGTEAPIERISETLGTIPYEVLTSVSPRVKRIYYRE